MKLNGWQRIGIVLSGGWILLVSAVAFDSWAQPKASGLFARPIMKTIALQTPPEVVRQAKIDHPNRPPEFTDFGPVREVVGYEFAGGRFLFWLLMPIAAVWALFYLVRWVVAGFKT